VEAGLPGSRLAINLTGVHPDELARGMVVARPGALRGATLVDVRLRMAADGAALVGRETAPLRHNQTVDFFCGAAETPAHVRLLEAEEIRPGETGWAQLRLETSVVVVNGDRFIIRQASPSMTVGGGQVVNAHPTRRWRRFQPDVIAQLETLARGTPEDLLLHAMAGIEPAPLKAIVERSGLDAAQAEATLAGMIAAGEVITLGPAQAPLKTSATPAISRGGWRQLSARMAEALSDYHAQYPLRPGMAREELKSRVQPREKWSNRTFNELATLAVAEGAIEEAGDFVRRPGFTLAFNPAQQARVDALLAAYRKQTYTPPSAAESTAMTSPDIVSALLHQGTLARLSEDVLLLHETYDEMVARVKAFIQKNGSMTVAQVRDEFYTSRKYALALMEHLDNEKITRRVGDERVLR
jgi:selenocysteine-specific elongation factor